MKKRILGTVVLLGIAASSAAQTVVDPNRLARLLQRAIILDLHDDTTQMVIDENYDLAKQHDHGQVDLPRLRKGDVSGVFLWVWTDALRYTPEESLRRALDQIDAIQRNLARYPREMTLAVTADQVLAARKRGQVAILLGVEGGHMIDSDLAILRTYYGLGVRYMTLTHTEHTPWADTASHPAAHNGLTDFGKQVVREMNRLGMMVDISHVSNKTFYDAIETSVAPVIASHSSCRAIDTSKVSSIMVLWNDLMRLRTNRHSRTQSKGWGRNSVTGLGWVPRFAASTRNGLPSWGAFR